MLSLAEYRAASAELLATAQQYEQKITKDLGTRNASDVAKFWATEYYQDYSELLHKTLHETAENAVNHYSDLLGVEPDPNLIQTIYEKQFTEPYWGANLTQRLQVNQLRLYRNAHRSSLVSPDAVTGLLTKTVPFGAQYNIDRRVLLSTMSKIENDASRAVAVSNNVKLIRWALSHAHSQRDECDDLATNVDEKVDQYIANNHLNISSKGIYFADELPPPPHPNCQCEYAFVSRNAPAEPGSLQRTFSRVTSLLRRLVRR